MPVLEMHISSPDVPNIGGHPSPTGARGAVQEHAMQPAPTGSVACLAQTDVSASSRQASPDSQSENARMRSSKLAPSSDIKNGSAHSSFP